MEKFMQSLFHFGSLLRSSPPAVSPALDDFDLLQFMRSSPVEEPSKDFKVFLNVALLEPTEVCLEVVDGKLLEVAAKHGKRSNTDGVCITRDIKYTYEIPKEAQGKALHAEWSEDGFLLVQVKPGKDVTAVGDSSRIRLVPEKVPYMARPAVEVAVVRDMFEDIRDKAMDALRYIGYHSREGTTKAEREAAEMIDRQVKGRELESKKSPEGRMKPEDTSKPSDMISKEASDPPVYYYCA